MADYSRFIAYIYEYVNGRKQYNAGFTKVEVRNGICKLQIVLKNTGRENRAKVYGLVRREGWLLGIFLGEGQIQRQGLDLRIATDSRKMGGSDYEFRKIAGLFIQGAEGRTYATAWDEEPLFLERFVTELPKETVLSAAQTQEEEEPVEMAKKPQPPQTCEIPQENDAAAFESPDQTGESLPENADESDGSGTEEDGQEKQTAPDLKEKEDFSQDADQSKVRDEPEEEKKEEWWHTILHSYPRIDPFEDEEISECIQIAPKDIMMIDKKQWRLGRNSFLLHGYYNYRHLLLGRTQDERWILGIPGVYDRQEHFVARRFGFPGFKPARPLKGGEQTFGYWCRVLRQ